MSLCKQLSISLWAVLLLMTPAYANMRAPVHVERAPGELRATAVEQLRVLSESLEFNCPEAYMGKVDYEAFSARVCDARVRYKISSTAAARISLVFLYSGNGDVTWKYGGKTFKTTSSERKGREKLICRYCPEDMKRIRYAEQTIDVVTGTSEVEITYSQPLSYDESGHSYFSSGKWLQGFSYELWPIAEWQWAPDFSAELNLSIMARSGFLGIGYKDDKIQCQIDENGKFTPVALDIGKVVNNRRTATAKIFLKKKPERLYCSYSEQ